MYCRRLHHFLLWTLSKLISCAHEAKLIGISRPNSMSRIVLGISNIAELTGKFPRLLSGLALQIRIYTRRALGRFRWRFTTPSVRAFIPHVLNVHFNIIPPSTPMAPQVVSSFQVFLQTVLFLLRTHATCPISCCFVSPFK